MKHDINPLRGIPTPSVEEIIDKCLLRLGVGVLDLGIAVERKKLRDFLCAVLRQQLTGGLMIALQKSCEKAIEHTIRRVGDEYYQQKRAQGIKDRRAARLERMAADQQEQKKARLAKKMSATTGVVN